MLFKKITRRVAIINAKHGKPVRISAEAWIQLSLTKKPKPIKLGEPADWLKETKK